MNNPNQRIPAPLHSSSSDVILNTLDTPLISSTSVNPSSGLLKSLWCSIKLAEKVKIVKIVNNVVLQSLHITHLPGRLERPEYECRPPCSTPQKQKVTEHVSCEGYSEVSRRWGRRARSSYNCNTCIRSMYVVPYCL